MVAPNQPPVVKVTDIYLAALALVRGLELRGFVREGNYWHFFFDANAAQSVFREWGDKSAQVNVSDYLLAVKFLRNVGNNNG